MDKKTLVRYYRCVGIKAVGFDLDGTLYPAWLMYAFSAGIALRHPFLLRAFGSARVALRREETEKTGENREKEDAVFGDFKERQASAVARNLASAPADLSRKIDRVIYTTIEDGFRHIKPYKGVLGCLETLRGSGFRLGLLSDLPPGRKIELMGLSPFFDAVLCSESYGALKPSVRPFLALAERLGARPEEVLYVGNNYEYDIVGARRAGMKTALIGGRRGRDADFSFVRWEDLSAWIVRKSSDSSLLPS